MKMVPKRVVLTLIMTVLKWIKASTLINHVIPRGFRRVRKPFFISISLQKTRFSPKVLARGDLSLLLQDTFGS